jgi:hypothetical protein
MISAIRTKTNAVRINTAAIRNPLATGAALGAVRGGVTDPGPDEGAVPVGTLVLGTTGASFWEPEILFDIAIMRALPRHSWLFGPGSGLVTSQDRSKIYA